MKSRLLNLLAANRKRGSFRAETSNAGNVIEVYDVIVSSEIDAEWFGGVAAPAIGRALKGMTGTVHMRINSPGGDVFAGVAIAQFMREYDGEIIVHVDGYAASIASIVAIAADKVIMAPGAMMMIHKAWTFSFGNSDDLLATAELLEKIDGQLVDAYVKRSAGKASADDFAAMLKAETWFTPQEAIDAGLCDEIAPDKDKPEAQALWDLSAFERAPKPAPPPDQSSEQAAAAREAAAVQAAADKAAADDLERRKRVTAARLLSTTA
ncbi:head maturation protease, ClpP-related [Bradyrhizobium sp. WSM4349]|uniref:head maturation protease, ClpP-related n=1 Tax=Bradyrhizobium sp. WSM4349 TaxID=1040988 RepID=UPI0003631CEB|nr:head maturation protease, ClpP-related [Bradyrhizobium sp. WSM4349]